jgi:hypothetical protein
MGPALCNQPDPGPDHKQERTHMKPGTETVAHQPPEPERLERAWVSDPSPLYLLSADNLDSYQRSIVQRLVCGDEEATFSLVQHPQARRLAVLLYETAAAGMADRVRAWLCSVADLYVSLYVDAQGHIGSEDVRDLRTVLARVRAGEDSTDLREHMDRDDEGAFYLACFVTCHYGGTDPGLAWEYAQHSLSVVAHALGDGEGFKNALARCTQLAHTHLLGAQVAS